MAEFLGYLFCIIVVLILAVYVLLQFAAFLWIAVIPILIKVAVVVSLLHVCNVMQSRLKEGQKDQPK